MQSQVLKFQASKYFPADLQNLELAILRGQQVIIECPDRESGQWIQKLTDFILDRKLEGDRQTQRLIVLKKLYNKQSEAAINIVVDESLAKEGKECKSFNAQLTPNFNIMRLPPGNHWLLKLGNSQVLLNPCTAHPAINISKIVMSSCTLNHTIALWSTVKQLKNPIPIITTHDIYSQLLMQLHYITLGLSIDFLQLVLPLELVKAGETVTLCHGAKIRMEYLAYYAPSVSVNIFYADRSVLILGDIYHHPRQFYYAWKEKRLSEDRYYQLVNRTLMDTLTILQKQSFSQQFLDSLKGKTAKVLNSNQNYSTTLVPSAHYDQSSTLLRIATISQIPLLEPLLTTTEIMNLLQQSSEQSFYEGQILLKEGMRSQKIYIIVSGSVRLNNEANTIDRVLSASDMICQDMINMSNISRYTVTCLSSTIVLSINRHCFLFIVRQETIKKALNIRNMDISNLLLIPLLQECHHDMLRWLLEESKSDKAPKKCVLYLDVQKSRLLINEMYFYGKEGEGSKKQLVGVRQKWLRKILSINMGRLIKML